MLISRTPQILGIGNSAKVNVPPLSCSLHLTAVSSRRLHLYTFIPQYSYGLVRRRRGCLLFAPTAVTVSWRCGSGCRLSVVACLRVATSWFLTFTLSQRAGRHGGCFKSSRTKTVKARTLVQCFSVRVDCRLLQRISALRGCLRFRQSTVFELGILRPALKRCQSQIYFYLVPGCWQPRFRSGNRKTPTLSSTCEAGDFTCQFTRNSRCISQNSKPLDVARWQSLWQCPIRYEAIKQLRWTRGTA